MTKKFEANVALVSGRNPGICRAIGDCIGAAYDASKHGVIGPAIIETPMVQVAVRGNQGPSAQLNATHPTGSLGKAEEEATVLLWLSSADTSFVTGHAPAVDGGRLL